MKVKLWASAIGLAVVVAAVLVWFLRSRSECTFSGWPKAIGVELASVLDDSKALQGKLGISDSQLAEFDVLIQKFAAKFDGGCQNFHAGKIPEDEYVCQSKNMDRALDDFRRFQNALEAAKDAPEPQKAVVQQALADLHAVSAGGSYRAGCRSSLAVTPQTLPFPAGAIVNSIQITNGGKQDMNFWFDDLPAAFDPRPASGSLSAGGAATIVLVRTEMPWLPNKPVQFHVNNSFEEDQAVEIAAGAAGTDANSPWPDLAAKAQETAQAKHRKPGVTDALAAVNAALSSDGKIGEGGRELLAAQLLFFMDETDAASKAAHEAYQMDASLARLPGTFVFLGLLDNRQGQSAQALEYFAKARDSVAPDAPLALICDLFSAGRLLQNGNSEAAQNYLSEKPLQELVRANPSYVQFGQQEFCGGEVEACRAPLAALVKRGRQFGIE